MNAKHPNYWCVSHQLIFSCELYPTYSERKGPARVCCWMGKERERKWTGWKGFDWGCGKGRFYIPRVDGNEQGRFILFLNSLGRPFFFTYLQRNMGNASLLGGTFFFFFGIKEKLCCGNTQKNLVRMFRCIVVFFFFKFKRLWLFDILYYKSTPKTSNCKKPTYEVKVWGNPRIYIFNTHFCGMYISLYAAFV